MKLLRMLKTGSDPTTLGLDIFAPSISTCKIRVFAEETVDIYVHIAHIYQSQ